VEVINNIKFYGHFTKTIGISQYQKRSQILTRTIIIGGLLRLHEADEAAVDWLTTYDS